MAEDNPKISVDYLKQNYPKISDLLGDEDLEEVVGELRREKIKTKHALEFVSRETLLAKNISGLFVDIVKPARGKPLCCRSAFFVEFIQVIVVLG